MSNDNFYSEENDPLSEEFSAPPKPGMSSGVKILLILLGVGSLCMLLCCGGLFWAAKQTDFSMEVTEKKDEIISIQNEITDITIPETFEPQAGVSFNILGKGVRMAIYNQASKQGMLTLISFSIPDDGMIDMEKEFRNSLNQQNQNQRELKITNSKPREFTIKDKKVNFTFAEGTDANDQEFRQVTGVFPGKNGPAFLMLQVLAEDYNEEEIVKMIESIK